MAWPFVQNLEQPQNSFAMAKINDGWKEHGEISVGRHIQQSGKDQVMSRNFCEESQADKAGRASANTGK
jgi:hypothetical protein